MRRYPETASPEIINAFPSDIDRATSFKSDVWALGIVVASLAAELLSPQVAISSGLAQLCSGDPSAVLQATTQRAVPTPPAPRERGVGRVWGEQQKNSTSGSTTGILIDIDSPSPVASPALASMDAASSTSWLNVLGSIDHALMEFVQAALDPNPASRPSSAELMTHPFLKGLRPPPGKKAWYVWPIVHCLDDDDDDDDDDGDDDADKLHSDLASTYYMWRLAVGPLEAALAEQSSTLGATSSASHFAPAILSIPRLGFQSGNDETMSPSTSAALTAAFSDESASSGGAGAGTGAGAADSGKAPYAGEIVPIVLDKTMRARLRPSELGAEDDVAPPKSLTRKPTETYDINKINFLGPEHDISRQGNIYTFKIYLKNNGRRPSARHPRARFRLPEEADRVV